MSEKKQLQEQIKSLKKENSILKKRDTALRKRFAYMFWERFIDNLDCNKEKAIKELDRLDECYEINENIFHNKKASKLMFYNKSWFVNKHIDRFLSRFN
ncbi:MAG: hypothetical protein BM557_01995 [Flavobacterium sp. MedPE-SWcel]|uniref:hypothetical protein n=1 Tax=uncultured Flavobacterium sp. TaxID=165435 RepID=UPI00091659C7|nr:hypothetical protein [uncultured Flavobacterium sp.]OIQ22169.1 MAG: hypothetical protein BM557_01995 [Flavobacterium sp. MedPE-SWcel]